MGLVRNREPEEADTGLTLTGVRTGERSAAGFLTPTELHPDRPSCLRDPVIPQAGQTQGSKSVPSDESSFLRQVLLERGLPIQAFLDDSSNLPSASFREFTTNAHTSSLRYVHQTYAHMFWTSNISSQ